VGERMEACRWGVEEGGRPVGHLMDAQGHRVVAARMEPCDGAM
jgi:hypothetical protein